MSGEGQVITGWQNKMKVAMAHVTPAEQLAKKHTKEAGPGVFVRLKFVVPVPVPRPALPVTI